VWLTACAPPQPPNVLLVVVDTLRADHTSAYGYERDTTPHLRALAEEGVRFAQAYAPVGLTAPTHASLFTSLHPLTHGLVRNGLELGPEHVTLAEFLSVRGYQTAAVVSSFVLHHKFGLRQGFALYDDAFERSEATVELAEWEGHDVEAAFDRRADHTTRRALHWLRERRSPGSPFFLFVHYFDPHSPYEPPASHAGRFTAPDARGLEAEVAAYDEEIAFTDAAIGELLDGLDELGLSESTIVLVTADHGEGLMQRGYMLHGVSVHEEELRVPLLLRWPDGVPGARVVEEPVSVLDVLPTVSALVGAGPGGTFQGRSLVAALEGGAATDGERSLYLYRRDFGREGGVLVSQDHAGEEPGFSVVGAQYALRKGRFKYVVAPLEAPPALYDLDDDPEELRNLAGERPEEATLRDELSRWVGLQRMSPAARKEPSEEDKARLRALGYAD